VGPARLVVGAGRGHPAPRAAAVLAIPWATGFGLPPRRDNGGPRGPPAGPRFGQV